MGKKAISILAAVLAVALVVVGILFFQAEQTVSQCRQDQSALIVKIDELNASLADRDSQIEALNANLADKDSQIEALNADVADRDGKIEALNADVADKDGKIEALNADVADKDSQIEALSADATDKDSQIAALNADVADRDGKIEALSADVADKDSKIEALSAEAADKDAAIESLTAELSQARESGAVEIPDSVPGKYATTRQLLYALDQAEINYTYDGIDSDGDEYIIIKDTCAGHPVTFRLWFSPDCEQANLRVWDIISFTSQQKNDVRIACDELNSSYKFAAFYLDYDSTITMSMDFILREDGKAGSIMLEGLMLAYSILEDAYPTLEACGK